MASGITAQDIVELFEKDSRARKRLAELLVEEPDVRLAIINAVLRDVATRHDLEVLRRELMERVDRLGDRIAGLESRISSVEGELRQLVGRLEDLDKRIDALDRRIDALDKRIDALDRRIDALDRRVEYVARLSIILTGTVVAALAANLIVLLVR